MRFLLMLLLAVVLPSCAVSPELAQSMSNKELCRRETELASYLTQALIAEIRARKVNCADYYREIALDKWREEEQAKRISEDRKAQLARNAEEAKSKMTMCQYCASVYPQEIFGKCAGINQSSCGSLWNDGRPKAVIQPLRKEDPSYRCRGVSGLYIQCDPY